MNIIQAFNKTIAYIEDNLEDEIDERQISLISGYSFAMFARIFSILTGYGLNEYIRLRKLTKSAFDLRDTNEKIIDIALKYGYDNANSFTFAFKKFHNHTPTDVRNGLSFNIFDPVKLSLTIKGGKDMEIKIEKKPSFKVAGVSIANATFKANFEGVWKSLFQKSSVDELLSIGDGISYGVCYEHRQDKEEFSYSYMAGFSVSDVQKAENLGLEILEIPKAEYAVIKLKGSIPQSIHQGWKYVMEEFLPENNYKHSGTPDFEVYYSGENMYSDDYEMQLWVPIISI